MGDVGSLLGKTKLAEYMEKNNELVLVGEREILDNQDSQENSEDNQDTIKDAGLDVSEDSAIDSQADKLINFDAPVTKLDTMTLDDLNDDDFNPRAIGATTSNPRTQSVGTPIIKPPNAVVNTPQATPTRILPPPTLPPRDPSKITAAKVPGVTNPFSSPASDPFGMSSFSTAKPSDPFSPPAVPAFGTADFSLDELDPLKK